jgi:hypothetical protein
MIRDARSMAVTVAVLASFAVAGCGADNASPELRPTTVSDRADGFVLSLTLPTDTFASADPIDLEAALTWEGAAATRKVWGPASGLVIFSARQLDGPREIGGASDAVCAFHEFKRGVPERSGYKKSGGWSATDPDAAFYRAFFADPQFRLPPGRWRISVVADGFLAECLTNAPRLALSVSADIIVR